MLIDWRAITRDGVTTTNYQLFPGDRIYIKADDWIAADNMLSKVIAPFERLAGFALLGWATLQRTARNPVSQSGSTSGTGGFP
jgi:hypothetical protein